MSKNRKVSRIVTQKPAIEVTHVGKSYGDVKALDGVDLKVEAGSIFALLGPNGAGKTTLVRILTTLLRPDSGTVTVGSHDAINDPQAVRGVIGLAGQNVAIDEIFTGRENLELVGRLYRLERSVIEKRVNELLQSFGLLDAADRQTKTYSGGMRRRLDLAASIVGEPKILFLDEPTTGLDPHSRMDLWKTIKDLVAKGVTVLLTTQYLEEADYLADMVAVIDHGKIIALDSPKNLKAKIGGDVIEIHLADHSRINDAVQTISKFGKGEPVVEAESGKIVLPVDGGASVLTNVVRELDVHQIAIDDLNFRRPSLDEVFISLTGTASATTETGQDKNPAMAGASQRLKSNG